MKCKRRIREVFSFVLVFAMVASLFTGMGTVTTKAAQATYFKAYKKAEYETISKDFSLKVNGQNVDVVSYYKERYSYAHIAYEGTTTFEIKALQGNIESYNISPHSYNIQAKVSGNTMTFDMEQKKSRYLVIDITAGGKKDQIVIAADPNLNLKAPEVDGNKVVSILDYGVVAGDKGDGSENSKKIQNAINDVSSRGGGTVIVPKGWYKFVTIDSKDNVTLYLEEGAVLRGSGDRTEYSWNPPGGNGRQVKRRDIKITSKNFKIIGEGMVDANAVVLALPQVKDRTDVPNTPQGDYYPTGWDDFRKGIVDADGADGITFTGVTFKDATGWTFNLMRSKNINISNVKMLDDYAVVHSDGYDIVACQDVEVTNCLGLCGDDVFCPKGSDSSREMKNYLYKDSVAYARGGAGCKVGVQAQSKSYNIEFNNIDVIQGYRGFSVSRDEGAADWSDIRFIDIRAEKVFVESNPTDGGQYRPAPIVIWAVQKNNVTGNVSDIEVTNCSIEDTSGIKAVMKGETVGSTGEKGTVSDVTFKNFVMEGRTITRDNWQRYFDVSGNVEKDTIKFENTEVLTPAISKYEAETASKSGSANYGKAEECSAGFKAGNIGKDSKVTFTVYEEEAGEHNINVYACTKGERTFEITVNGEENQTLVCNGDSFGTPILYKIKANLKQGENKIVFGNANEAAPDLDKIEVIEYEPQKALSLEAEVGELTEAKPVVVTGASNGYCVENIGGTDKGTVLFKANAKEAGEREIKVYYAADRQSKLNVVVNGDTYALDCPSTGSLTTISKTPASVTVKLNKNENIIQLKGADGADAPIVDRILIEMSDEEAQSAVQSMIDALPAESNVIAEDEMRVNAVQVSYNALLAKTNVNKAKLTAALAAIEDAKMLTIEVEAGVLAPTDVLTIEESDKCSNGYFVGEMGSKTGGTVTFKIQAEEAGTRKLNVYYITEMNRKLSVKVNDGAAQTLSCNNIDKIDWKTPESEPASAEIELKKGENTLVLSSTSEDNAFAPNLDKLEIELTAAEAAKTVEGLIANLPDKLEDDNKLYFNAVKTSYDDLSDKKAVTNGAILREALGMPEEPEEDTETPKEEESDTPGEEEPDISEEEDPDTSDKEKPDKESPDEEAPDTSDDEDLNPPEEEDPYIPEGDGSGTPGEGEEIPGEGEQIPDKDDSEVVVTFDSAGGTMVSKQTLQKGDIAEKPLEDPVKTGYIFVGWYIDEVKYEFDTPVEESIVLTAKWKEQEKDEKPKDDQKLPSDDTNGTEQKDNTTDISQTTGQENQNNGQQTPDAVKVQGINLSGISKKIAVGRKIALDVEIMPANATNKALIWSSSNTDYASVDANGLVTTKKAGANKKVTITAAATDESGVVAEYNIQLMQNAVKKIKLSVGNKNVKAGKKISIRAEVTPKASSKKINNTLKWMSSNPNYATVTSRGVVKTKKSAKGKTVKITAMATDGTNKKATIKLTIK